MKFLFIGDLHGLDVWKKMQDVFDQYDQIIFIGDYVDSFEVSDLEMLDNLNQIVTLKKERENVILLLGNHDIHYMFPEPEFRCSGFKPKMLWPFHEIFDGNKNLFQIAWQHNNILATHAGVSETWLKKSIENYQLENLAQQLNDLMQTGKGLEFLMAVGYRRGGIYPFGGPLWLDWRELQKDYMPGLIQVVGHTAEVDIYQFTFKDGSRIINIDCLERSKHSLFLEFDGEQFNILEKK